MICINSVTEMDGLTNLVPECCLCDLKNFLEVDSSSCLNLETPSPGVTITNYQGSLFLVVKQTEN